MSKYNTWNLSSVCTCRAWLFSFYHKRSHELFNACSFQLFVKNWKSHFYCFKDKFKSAIKSIERLLDSNTVTIGYKINTKSMCSCLKIHKLTTFSTCLLNSCLNDLLKDSNLCFTISFDLLLRAMLCKCRVPA
jgi:hypothetical protein